MFKLFIAVVLLKLCNAETENRSNNNNGGKYEISSPINGKGLRIFGDSIVIAEKENLNSSTDLSDCHDCDDFEKFVRGHVLRIRSPRDDDKFYDFELEDLIPDNNKLKGRARRKEFKKNLLPILVALKLKSTVLVPILLAFVALIAFKGFWAGMTSLLVSKALALKVFYNFDDYDDYGEHHQYGDDYGHLRFRGGANGPNGRPIVIYLNGNSKSHDRYHEDIYKKEYEDYNWDSWKKNYLNWDRKQWQPNRPL